MKKYMKLILMLAVAMLIIIISGSYFKKTTEEVKVNENVKLYPVLNAENGLYGYVNRDGYYIIEPQFYKADVFDGKYAKVYMNDDEIVNMINEKGELILPKEEFTNIRVDKDFIIASTKDFKSSIFNSKGEKVIEGDYHLINPYDNGLIVAVKDDNIGVFDFQGKVIVPMKKDYTLKMHDKYISWNTDNTSILVDLKGKEILKIKNSKRIDEAYDNIVINQDINDKYNIYTIKGKKLTEPIYEMIGKQSEGLLPASKDFKYGFISEKGEEKIPFIYDMVSGFADGYSSVQKDGKHGIIDKNNKVIVDIKYDDIIEKTNKITSVNGKYLQYVVDDRVAVKEDDRVYLVDLEGKRATSSYDNIQYADGKDGELYIIGTVARITDDGFVGNGVMLIDKNDNFLSGNLADMNFAPYGLMYASDDSSQTGYIINNKGEILNKNLYGVSFADEGYDSFVTTKGNGWAVLSKDGAEIITFDESVESIKIYDDGLYYLVYKDGREDLIDKEGKSLISKGN